MKVQGDLRIRFMQMGVGEAQAGELAEEALHIIATSDIVLPALRSGYESSLTANEEE